MFYSIKKISVCCCEQVLAAVSRWNELSVVEDLRSPNVDAQYTDNVRMQRVFLEIISRKRHWSEATVYKPD